MYNWAYKGVLPSTESRGSWWWQRAPWIWNALSPPLLLLALRSSAETMSHPKEVNAKAALYWRRLPLKWRPWVPIRSSKSFKYSGGSGKSCSWADLCLYVLEWWSDYFLAPAIVFIHTLSVIKYAAFVSVSLPFPTVRMRVVRLTGAEWKHESSVNH